MNYAKGGRRVLLVLLVLQWLIVGGVTLSAVLGSKPANLPYPPSFWAESLIGVAAAALLCSHGFYSLLDAPTKGAVAPGGAAFIAGVWGMVSSFFGWAIGVACVIAAAGGWDSMGSWFFRNMVGAAIPTAAAIGVIWFTPIAILLFVSWVWDGFASKQS